MGSRSALCMSLGITGAIDGAVESLSKRAEFKSYLPPENWIPSVQFSSFARCVSDQPIGTGRRIEMQAQMNAC
jgi:hypothetical protein